MIGNIDEKPATSQEVQIIVRTVPDLPEALHANALVHRILAARGVTDNLELNFSLADLPRPDSLPNIDKAVARLLEARDQGESVLIVGDYDCDGATSTSVALLGLAMLGFRKLDFLIPSRFEFGYGLSPGIVEIAHADYQASLILTVDNGVASVDGVERARQLGMDVIVTDHHLAPEHLPEALAIVNPNLPGARFPARNLAGVGVIFYTLLAIRSRLAELGDIHAKAALVQLLDLVAIGTVADLVPMDQTNRTLVEQGLRRIRSGVTRPGVLALLKVAGRDREVMNTQDIGFGLGPRINAAGRLDDMSVGVRCLMSLWESEAGELASRLDNFNRERRLIEAQMHDSANEQLALLAISEWQQSSVYSICLMDDDWHEGVIGILAGRIKDRLNRPCVLFTGEGEARLKGSARSVKGVHIRDVLNAIATAHPELIEKFGGHAMAAGLTIRRDSFETFRQLFEDTVSVVLNGQLTLREFEVDGTLTPAEVTLDNAALLANLMPWGQAFEAPLFVGEFEVLSRRGVGKNGVHLKLSLQMPGLDIPLDAIAFNCEARVEQGDWIRMVYSLALNHWQGQQRLQLRVMHLEDGGLS